MAKDVNAVRLVGAITTDIVLKESAKGVKWMAFSVVTNYFKKEQNGETKAMPTFHSCNAFGKVAEFIAENFRKGSRIDLTGTLSTGSYLKDNVKHYTTNITVQEAKADEQAAKEEPKSAIPPKVESVPSDSSDDMPF